jgi:hypothetical protein
MLRIVDLNQHLDVLAQQPQTVSPVELAFRGGVCRCHFEAVDRIGCSVWQIDLELAQQQSDFARLRKVGEHLCNQLRYLVEPLRIIEVDAMAATVQARSVQPTSTPQGPTYYELVIRDDGLRLVRYQAPPGQSRQQVAMHLTREVLLRLVGDLVAAMESLS